MYLEIGGMHLDVPLYYLVGLMNHPNQPRASLLSLLYIAPKFLIRNVKTPTTINWYLRPQKYQPPSLQEKCRPQRSCRSRSNIRNYWPSPTPWTYSRSSAFLQPFQKHLRLTLSTLNSSAASSASITSTVAASSAPSP